MRYNRSNVFCAIRSYRTMIAGVVCSLAIAVATSLAAEVASRTFRISTAQGSASEPLEISLDWSQPQPLPAL
jgi:hypothetical protein